MANALGLSEEHENNLRTLAQGLLDIAEGRKVVPAKFHMLQFAENTEPRTECGSVGCAVGHGPFFGMPKRERELWVDYCYRVFGIYDCDEGYSTCAFEWMFGGDWTHTDNTPDGAARRILHALEYGIPDDWEDQQMGDGYMFANNEGVE